MAVKVVIRKYDKSDYDAVCRLFYNGIVENWIPAYRRMISGKAPGPFMLQLVQLFLLYTYTSSMLWFIFIEFLVQVFWMFFFFYAFWGYAWEHLNSDMRDKELTYWTCRGVQTAGFYVATIDDDIVGTIAYLKESDHQVEIFRLSTDKQYRREGVAAKLVAKIERVAAVLKCSSLKAATSSAQEAALKFYNRNHWAQQSRFGHTGHFLHGIDIVTFLKTISPCDDCSEEQPPTTRSSQLPVVKE